jgi:hypothetical protein
MKTTMPTKICAEPKSRLLAAMHESARDLHSAGFIRLRRMREYDALCLGLVFGRLQRSSPAGHR